MNTTDEIRILPYSLIVGQEMLKLALELSYVAPRIEGVLISGHRGTGKSTAVRAFAMMMHGHLPVTLPINATDDRVIGGWKIDELMLRSTPEPQPGLLEEADAKGMLYIDEVNLLDDHIVNLILDVASTGVLVVQREGLDVERSLSFTLVGTMNPEEGGLRPQLLDRFGLMVNVTVETDQARRAQILQTVLRFDEATTHPNHEAAGAFVAKGIEEDKGRRKRIEHARHRLYDVVLPPGIAQCCAELGREFQAAGHRGDYVMALAARALAALEGAKEVTSTHVQTVAPLALQHRRPELGQGSWALWTAEDEAKVASVLARMRERA
jgi:magnesium chelatase subunit I